MSEAHTGGCTGGAIRSEGGNAAALGAADWLCLAAAPTFAIMALLTGVLGGGPHDMLCPAAQDASPLSGMAMMYLLDECLPFDALAEADLQPAKRCPPVLIRRSLRLKPHRGDPKGSVQEWHAAAGSAGNRVAPRR